MRCSRVVAVLTFCLALTARPTVGVVFNHTGDIAHNTTAPAGEHGGAYDDSGWQWMGSWQVGSGVAISSRRFLTAGHFWLGDTFTLTDQSAYTYVKHWDDPASDLRIVEVAEAFSSWAPLYTGAGELGREVVFFGRGDTRGDEVAGKGWKWSTEGRGTMRWGTNTVSDYANYNAGDGGLLGLEFDRNGSTADTHEEAAAAEADSGGGVFINDGGTWKLAGVMFAAEGPYDEDADHSAGTFGGAIYDRGGLYENQGPAIGWTLIRDRPSDKPQSFYATRVSARADWIAATLAQAASLTWDGTAGGQWTGAHWGPGPVAPVGGEPMVVKSGSVIVSADLTATPAGSLDLAAGAAGRSVTIGPAGKLRVSGKVVVGPGAELVIDGVLANSLVKVSGGTLANSPATTAPIAVDGEVVLYEGAELAIEVIGAGTDRLVPTSTVYIGADVALDTRISGGGNEFRAGAYEIIDAVGVSGTFASVTDLGAYVTGDGLTYDAAGGTVTLTLEMDLNPGDANLDGATDVSDRIIWNDNNFTIGTTFVTGDFNNDGVTDVSDRIIWNSNNFTSATAAAPAEAAGAGPTFQRDGPAGRTRLTVIPEPATICLLALGGLVMIRPGRRRSTGAARI